MSLYYLDVVNDYIFHWWNGDASKYYLFMWLEIPQANKLFKVGLYIAGLAALFDLIKFKEVVCRARDAYCAVTYTFKFAKFLFNIYDIIIRLLFIPAYYLIAKFDDSKPLPLPLLFKKVIDHHVTSAVDEARWRTSRKWISRFLSWMERHSPSNQEIRATIYVFFVILSALEIMTS